MRRFVLGWKMFGLERTPGTRLVTYADDLVILCRRGKAEAALQRLREIMSKLKLTVNEEKTRICKVPEGEFDFLGYSVLQRHGKEVLHERRRSCLKAAQMMRAGPSGSAFRSGSQTTPSCCVQKARW